MHAADFRILPVSQVNETNTVYGTPYLVGSTIASGASASGVIDAGKMLPMNITTPSDLRSVSTLTITHSDQPNGTFTPLIGTLNDGTQTAYTITLHTSVTIPLDTSIIQGLGYIKLIPNQAPSGGDLVLKIGGKQAA